MAQLSQEVAFVNSKFGDFIPDVIVYIKSHGSLIIDKEIQQSSSRVDSYDIFSLDEAFDNILIFMLSGIGNGASDIDPMLSVFPTITPDYKFSDIFKFLDDNYKGTQPERIKQYQQMNSPLGSYSVQPLIQGKELTSSTFINKYFLLTEFEDGDDIYVKDNKGNEFCLTDLEFVSSSLSEKKSISYDEAVSLVEFAVTVDTGLVGGYDVSLPGEFDDKRRIQFGRIQRITLREIFYLLYLLGYKSPLILDASCTANLSLTSDKTERLSGRTAVKMKRPLIDVDSLLVTYYDEKSKKMITNFTSYDIKNFQNFEYIILNVDGCTKSLAKSVVERVNNTDLTVNLALVRGAMYVMKNSTPDCSENLAISAISRSINKDIENLTEAIQESISRALELAHAALYVMNSLPGCSENLALKVIGKTKNPDDGSLNPDAAIQYLLRSKGGKRIKKTMRRSKKSIRRSKKSIRRSKKTIRRKK